MFKISGRGELSLFNGCHHFLAAGNICSWGAIQATTHERPYRAPGFLVVQENHGHIFPLLLLQSQFSCQGLGQKTSFWNEWWGKAFPFNLQFLRNLASCAPWQGGGGALQWPCFLLLPGSRHQLPLCTPWSLGMAGTTAGKQRTMDPKSSTSIGYKEAPAENKCLGGEGTPA